MMPATLPSQGIVTGPPVSSTTIVRGFAAASFAISASWPFGRAREPNLAVSGVPEMTGCGTQAVP